MVFSTSSMVPTRTTLEAATMQGGGAAAAEAATVPAPAPRGASCFAFFMPSIVSRENPPQDDFLGCCAARGSGALEDRPRAGGGADAAAFFIGLVRTRRGDMCVVRMRVACGNETPRMLWTRRSYLDGQNQRPPD